MRGRRAPHRVHRDLPELRLQRLRDLVTHDAADAALEREAALLALAQLSEEHREALLLIAWDSLTPAEAARVLGIKEPAFRARVHRARRALEGPDRPVSRRPSPTVRQTCTEETP